MNKSLTVSFAFSLGLHLSTITLAKEGMILQEYLYNPKELFMKAMQNPEQMNLLFVDTVPQDLSGAKPVAAGIISDNDNVAQDRSLKHVMGNLAPDVGKAVGAKQLGDTSPGVGPHSVPGENVQMMDDITVKPPAPGGQSQGYYPRKGKPPLPAPKTPQLAEEEKKIPYLDVSTKNKPADVFIPGQTAKKTGAAGDKKDMVTMREQIEDWLAEQDQDAQDESPPGADEGREDVPGKKAPDKRGSVSLVPGSLKKLSGDESGDVERFGEITFNAQKFAIGHYFKKMKDKVEGYWLPYLAFTYSGDSFKENKTVVLFRIYPSGEVKNVKVLEHRGDEILRDFCVAAIKNTAPYDPLPETFLSMVDYGYLPIVFTFMY
jgi:hypothetical protein